MKRTITSLLFLLSFASIPFISHAQAVNIALSAVATHSGGGNSALGYGPELYNNNVIPPPGTTGTYQWGWVSTNGWIEFTWTSPQSVAKIKFWKQNRPMTTCTVQYWNGSAYVNIMTYNNTAAPIVDSVVFTPVSTTKIRLSNVAGSSNPNHGEIQIYGPAYPNDVSAQAILQPAGNAQQCFGGTQVKVRLYNSGSAAQSNFPVSAAYSGPAGSGTISAVYTGNLTPNMIDSIVVGTINPQPGNYDVIGYTHLANDQDVSNDTTGNVFFTVLPPVAAPTVFSDTVCMGNNALVTVDAQIGSQYKWYSASSGGTLVHTGTSVNFPSLTQDTTMYVSSTTNGCESSRAAAHAAIGPPPVVNLGNDTSFCESIPLILNAGNPGGEYTWSNGDSTQVITILNQSGTYWVVVDKYCVATDTVEVTIAPMPKVNGISYVRMANTYHFTGSNAQNVDTWFWDFGDGNTSTLPNPVHTFANEIDVALDVMLIVTNTCGSDTVGRNVPTSVQNLSGSSDNVLIYPNPATAQITVDAGKLSINELQIVSLTGSLVATYRPASAKTTINIHDLAAGNYIIRVFTKNGSIYKPLQVTR